MFLSCYIIFKKLFTSFKFKLLEEVFCCCQTICSDGKPPHSDERTGAAENILLSGHPP